MANKKDKSGRRIYTGPFEKVMVPDGKGGFESRMVPEINPKVDAPSKMTLEQRIIKKIRERASKKMGGVMKAKFGRSIQDPQKPSKAESLRDKIKKTLPKTKEGIPVRGKMKKPKPGSYDYQLESTMKPPYKGMRVGGMCRGMGAAIKGGRFGGVK